MFQILFWNILLLYLSEAVPWWRRLCQCAGLRQFQRGWKLVHRSPHSCSTSVVEWTGRSPRLVEELQAWLAQSNWDYRHPGAAKAHMPNCRWSVWESPGSFASILMQESNVLSFLIEFVKVIETEASSTIVWANLRFSQHWDVKMIPESWKFLSRQDSGEEQDFFAGVMLPCCGNRTRPTVWGNMLEIFKKIKTYFQWF